MFEPKEILRAANGAALRRGALLERVLGYAPLRGMLPWCLSGVRRSLPDASVTWPGEAEAPRGRQGSAVVLAAGLKDPHLSLAAARFLWVLAQTDRGWYFLA